MPKASIVILLFILLNSVNGCRKIESLPDGNTLSGLDGLAASDFQLLQGKRVGVITNQTGVDRHGRHIADILHQTERVDLKALFGPEHGIRGQMEGGAEIDTGVDAKTGVPIYSLYGKTRKPTPDMLKNLDVLVFDIQDIGTRFYTYISTMSLAMEAAAENGIPFVVLDRPNPIGGIIVEGPVLHTEHTSFVGIHPIPLRHGMTVGELAQLFNEEGFLTNGIRAELIVVPIKNWRRDMFFRQTGLPWIKPSPNMPSITAAVVYPGMGLIEATNISEGRGTKHPFEIVGAPWINSAELAEALHTFQQSDIDFDTTSFVPVDVPGAAMNPKHEGQLCYGLLLRPTKPSEFQSVEFGIHFLATVRKLYPEHFEIRENGMNRLAGTANVYNALIKGTEPDSIIAAWQPELADFLKVRERYLLYE